ncbi:MAG: hypothetical protein RL033_3533 [Pseudomonadota bacterium]
MKVQCGHCPAKYAVADERIRDKKVRIRCRRCNAAIVVDGKVSPPLVTSTPARPSLGSGSHAPGLESLPPSSPPPDHPRPMAHTIMGGLEAPATHQLMQDHVGRVASARWDEEGEGAFNVGMPDASRGLTDPPAHGESDRWRVALTQQDLRWMTTEEITEAFKDGAVKSETFVFRAGMPTWVTLMEVSEIAQALADAQLVSPPLQKLHLAEDDADPSSPPQRISSLPPPRKAARNRAEQPLAELALAAADGPSDSEESLPFALVPDRAGSKQPSDEAAEHETAAPSPPPTPSPVPPEPDVGAAPPVAPAAAPAAQPSSFEVSAAPAAAPPPKTGSSAWIWVSLVILLAVAGAVFLLGPRFGLHLR